MVESEEEEEEDELSDEEIDRQRQTLHQKVLNRNEEEVCFKLRFSRDVLLMVPKVFTTVCFVVQEVEVLDKEEEGLSPEESTSESSVYEEYTGW
jgi:hypothetical protein